MVSFYKEGVSMQQFYIHTTQFINKTNFRKNIFLFFSNYLPYVVAICYIAMICYLFVSKNIHLLEMIYKPAFVFFFVTIFRKIMNRPRPHVTFKFEPLCYHKENESFPSRHSASAFIIAFMAFLLDYYLGWFLFIIACLISISRVLVGLHYISDVLASFLIAFFVYFI